MLYQYLILQALSSPANAETDCGGYEQQCCRAVAYGGRTNFSCDPGLSTIIWTDWKTEFCACQYVNDGNSNRLGHPHAIGTVELKRGEQCIAGGAQQQGMKRQCEYPLLCKTATPNSYYGTCEFRPDPWAKPTLTSQEGGLCGSGDSPSMTAYKCANGLKCVSSDMPGSYGRCERSIVTSQEGGPCGSGDSPSMTDYKCADGLTCITVYIPGHYGYCKKEITWSHAGGLCGEQGWENGVYLTKEYRCKGDLVCHVAVEGHYGHCRRPHHHFPVPSPVPSPVSPPSGFVGTVCGSGSAGNMPCQDGLICFGANPSASLYGTCQEPGFGGRRLQLGESEFEPDQLEAPLAEE